MTDSCYICETEAISLDDWYLKTQIAHGKIAVVECICPWCVKDMIQRRLKDLKINKAMNDVADTFAGADK